MDCGIRRNGSVTGSNSRLVFLTIQETKLYPTLKGIGKHGAPRCVDPIIGPVALVDYLEPSTGLQILNTFQGGRKTRVDVQHLMAARMIDRQVGKSFDEDESVPPEAF